MTTKPASSSLSLKIQAPLFVQVRRGEGQPVLAREPVNRADLSDAVSEAWREGCLRAGFPGTGLWEVSATLAPVVSEKTNTRCQGFAIELAPPGGSVSRREFSILSLRHVAERAAAPLVEADLLRAGESFFYELVIDPAFDADKQTGEEVISIRGSVRSTPLKYLHMPLRPWLEKATPVDLIDDEVFPVFFTREAFAKAESCARRGGEANPPVETGGVFFGSLVSCPISGEFGAVVTDVIEVHDAEQKTFSLSYSSRSWMRIQAVQSARQTAYPQRFEKLLGQAHGHSFLPNDGKVCAECKSLPVCNLTSVFVSLDDQTWHRAVFSRQPWALCHIFGLTARGEPVNRLYGLKDGRLQARGYYLIPEFPCD